VIRVATYARFSSDLQRDASIADQQRECREYVKRRGKDWLIEQEFSDAAMSGATIHRPGFQALMKAATSGYFDVVLAESLDRFSRDQEDTAALFKRLSFINVQIITLAEGEISHLHVGFKGTMNAIYLKDLADKTRRGLRGRVEAGKSGGGKAYGYAVRQGGERGIEPNEAAIVLRIFSDYAAGVSPQTIAKRLNGEGVYGPGGRPWGPSTIHGHAKRGTGILNNELYAGRMVWNRLRYIKDPDTGRRVSRLNSPEHLVMTEVPDLRIVPDALWQRVKARQQRMSATVVGSARGTKGLCNANRPLYLFSGLIKCGVCGHAYTNNGRRLVCSGHRERGVCTNNRTIQRAVVETRVLAALEARFLQGPAFEEFCRVFWSLENEARMQRRANIVAMERELVQVKREIEQVVDAVVKGWADEELRTRMDGLQARKLALVSTLATAGDPPPLLGPNMGALFAEKVNGLRQALTQTRVDPTEAQQSLRQLVDEIRLTPRDGALAIDVKGNLAAMLTAAVPADWERHAALVAGGGFEPPTFGL
jgi:site-specific DNA recombinase